MKEKTLEFAGECDYDYKYDILFFKVKGRQYLKSIELGNLIIDLDSEKFLNGIQVLEASKFLGLEREKLREILTWNFVGRIEDNKIEVRLAFQVKSRNLIIEKNSIIIQNINDDLPNSQIVCR